VESPDQSDSLTASFLLLFTILYLSIHCQGWHREHVGCDGEALLPAEPRQRHLDLLLSGSEGCTYEQTQINLWLRLAILHSSTRLRVARRYRRGPRTRLLTLQQRVSLGRLVFVLMSMGDDNDLQRSILSRVPQERRDLQQR
jgi:hypothetical protein